MEAEILLTPDDVAKALRVSVHTLASWRRTMRDGRLPYIEVEGQIRYRAGDVDRWLTERTKGPEAATDGG